MKYFKMLGLAAVAATASTAIVCSSLASANTVLCETTITTGCAAAGWDLPAGTELAGSLKSGTTSRTTDTSGFITIETCTGASLKAALSTTTTPKGFVSAANLTITGCTRPQTVITGGELELHHIAGTHNGTVTATGFASTIEFFNETCAFGLIGTTDMGTVTPSANGKDAETTINVNLSLIPAHSEPGCPTSTKWTATLTQTSDTAIFVSES